MELIVVTPPAYFEGEGKLINDFFDTGLERIHIRKPDQDPLLFCKLMKTIEPEYYPRIAIHQHHDLAGQFGLQRLHFTEQQRMARGCVKLHELTVAGYLLSSSVHQADTFAGLEDLNYVFFGPVFDSISKQGYVSNLHTGFVLPPHNPKVIAIGGVTAGRVEEVKRMNFDGAAVLGSLWHQDIPPLSALKIMMNAFKEF